jgi:hypothetical protein
MHEQRLVFTGNAAFARIASATLTQLAYSRAREKFAAMQTYVGVR